jgi:hypothetical protein
MDFYRNGLLIIRAWMEKGSSKPLRAHIRATSNVNKAFDKEVTVTDVPAATKEVEAWLDDIVAADVSKKTPL